MWKPNTQQQRKETWTEKDKQTTNSQALQQQGDSHHEVPSRVLNTGTGEQANMLRNQSNNQPVQSGSNIMSPSQKPDTVRRVPLGTHGKNL